MKDTKLCVCVYRCMCLCICMEVCIDNKLVTQIDPPQTKISSSAPGYQLHSMCIESQELMLLITRKINSNLWHAFQVLQC